MTSDCGFLKSSDLEKPLDFLESLPLLLFSILAGMVEKYLFEQTRSIPDFSKKCSVGLIKGSLCPSHIIGQSTTTSLD